jgi:hypothetical protein
MANLPEFPGKGLIEGATKRTWVVVTAVGGGAVAVGGFVVKRVLGHGDEDADGRAGASADPIAETPTAPPGAEGKPVPRSKPKLKPVKEKPTKPKPPNPKTAKRAEPKAAERKAGKPATIKGDKAKSPRPAPKPKAPEPPEPTGTDAPPKPEAEPGKVTGGKGPHHALNNPVVDDPDMTEYPDPYDTREDPLDPADPDGAPFGEEPHPQTGAESTSEPPLEQDPEVEDGGRPPRREKLDD